MSRGRVKRLISTQTSVMQVINKHDYWIWISLSPSVQVLRIGLFEFTHYLICPETMEDWDQETLEKVVESKKMEYQQNKPTDIVCTTLSLFCSQYLLLACHLPCHLLCHFTCYVNMSIFIKFSN
jgi:hypothetical protein